MFKYLLSKVGKLIYLKFFIPQNIGEKDFGIFPNLAENDGPVKPAPKPKNLWSPLFTQCSNGLQVKAPSQ